MARAEQYVLPDGRVLEVGDPMPTLCDTCPVHDMEVPPVMRVVVRLDYRNYGEDPGAAPDGPPPWEGKKARLVGA